MNKTVQIPGCVLIADDYPDAAASLSLLLQAYGVRCIVAFDGASALRMAETHRPFAALLDLGLPGLDGYELAAKLRSAEWGRGVLLVAITAWGHPSNVARATQAGFDHYFVKPVEDPLVVVALVLAHASRGGS